MIYLPKSSAPPSDWGQVGGESVKRLGITAYTRTPVWIPAEAKRKVWCGSTNPLAALQQVLSWQQKGMDLPDV